ncbi:DUF6465 family protein [Clostridium oryzae]|nr:DUF6465 family protein [Clostridium oryzae]
MKNNLFIQFNSYEVSEDHIIKALKENWLAQGKRVKDMKNVSIYFKVEDKTAYCVINGKEHIDIAL